MPSDPQILHEYVQRKRDLIAAATAVAIRHEIARLDAQPQRIIHHLKLDWIRDLPGQVRMSDRYARVNVVSMGMFGGLSEVDLKGVRLFVDPEPLVTHPSDATNVREPTPSATPPGRGGTFVEPTICRMIELACLPEYWHENETHAFTLKGARRDP